VARTALVVGASGFLGRAVVERLRTEGWTVVGTYCSTMPSETGAAGARDHLPDEAVRFDFWTDDLRAHVNALDPDAVVFAAAVEYGGEADTGDSDVAVPFERRARAVAEACADRRFVYVSSAAVFDGTEGRYDEFAARSPRDEYGRRLVAFEDAVAVTCGDAAVLRTSYLFGFAGGTLDDRLARTRDSLDRGESVAYFADMYKSPVVVSEAAAAVETLATTDAVPGDNEGPFVLHAPAPRTSVYDFHSDAMGALGRDPAVIEAEPIPPDMDVAPDTSLRSARFESLVGFEPTAVGPALRSQLSD